MNTLIKKHEGFSANAYKCPAGVVTIGEMMDTLKRLGAYIPTPESEWWNSLGLEDYMTNRNVTRLEAAVVIDALFEPFEMRSVDIEGNF